MNFSNKDNNMEQQEIVRYELIKENEREVTIQIPAYNDIFVLNKAEFNFFKANLPKGFIYGRTKHKEDDKIYFVENGEQF